MVIQIDLPPEDLQRLEARAKDLGMPVEDLARGALRALAQQPTDEFRAVARRALEKNAELMRKEYFKYYADRDYAPHRDEEFQP